MAPEKGFEIFGNTEVVLLDGGLATTLEDFGLDYISNQPLWSTEAVRRDPEVLKKAHCSFLEAGSQIILTDTYQSGPPVFERVGLSMYDMGGVMLKAVEIAQQAKDSFQAKAPQGPHIGIALSLGPFGANLVPTQEYGANYPPPYGPEAYSEDGNTNSFDDSDDGKEAEERAVKSLELFHFNRLILIFEDETTWNSISCLAFETVPLACEIRAIRKAMRRIELKLQQPEHQRKSSKPWWISFVMPNGRGAEIKAGGEHVSAMEMADAALHADEGLSLPSALGLNCTSPEYLRDLVGEVTKYIEQKKIDAPWLVIYPNKGDVYDEKTRAWQTITTTNSWAKSVGQIVKEVNAAGVWNGILAGGCCRTTPADIAQLKKALLY